MLMGFLFHVEHVRNIYFLTKILYCVQIEVFLNCNYNRMCLAIIGVLKPSKQIETFHVKQLSATTNNKSKKH